MAKTPRQPRIADMLMPFLVVFAFALMQTLCYWVTRNVILSSLLSGITSVVLLARPVGPIRLKDAFRPAHMPIRSVLPGIMAGMISIVATALLSELVQLSDPTAHGLVGQLDFPVTWVTVGLTGPICEELLFREGIQGGLTRKGMQPVWAIAVGCLLFSLAHAGSAQRLAAISSGIVLGSLYHRSQNILLCSLVHITNNLLGLIQLRLLQGGATTTPLLDTLKSRLLAWALFAALVICIGVLLWQMFTCKKEITPPSN